MQEVFSVFSPDGGPEHLISKLKPFMKIKSL